MVAHEGHSPTPTASAAPSMEGMGHGSTGMQMSFFTATNTMLFSESWTPSSAGAYAGTCIFLIVLAILLRAILTAKTWLDARAMEAALKRRYVVVADQQILADKAGDSSSMTGILTTNGVQENVKVVSAPVKHIQPWRFSVDLPRAAIMTVAVAIGYLLMLAVMTYNVGYFLSILAGAFIGELAFGRFMQGAMTM
ncbi:Ctr copper transporter-like protein [Dendryphion nanum]|uniref:Copper transport protein n=1 Tax=Dendryphion nanum TaxID=256645 RepID=A0A9P9DCP9_9PLEO|nr:Ctr copper transporter-like protein [Dendryphion nanum]